MAITYPAPTAVNAYRALDYGHCCDYVALKLTQPGAMGLDWRITCRLLKNGEVQKPVIEVRRAEAYQRPNFEPLEKFQLVPDDVQRAARNLVKNIQRAIAPKKEKRKKA